MTPAALEDLAEHMTQRVAPADMPYVGAALARRLAEAMRTIEDLKEENEALRSGS
jgi:molybdopterin-guanine dinucleotide biosynthesis protein A